MHVVISYDITCAGRRTKIHDTLKNYGERIQFSVFECQLSTKELRQLHEELEPLIDEEAGDSVAFTACAASAGARWSTSAAGPRMIMRRLSSKGRVRVQCRSRASVGKGR
jgi:CRISPR-associated protein Cas2